MRTYPSHLLPRSSPEKQGISSRGILAFLEAAEKQAAGKRSKELHSFMLLRHGHVVAEGWWLPYASGYPHMLFSLSKSFTSTAVGLAVSEGLLSVDDPVISFFPEEAPENPGEHLKAMRVRHLLSMSTGHAKDSTGYLYARKDGNWAAGFFDVPVEYVPGTHFLYNTGATYMLSAILHRLTGEKLLDYLRPRLFEPLGIENPTWETCPRGINTGGFGLNVTTEDIAKFGQLYLQKGRWNEQQIIPGEWVEEAVKVHISNGTNPDSEWEQGYGYQFWRCRHGAYRGDGAFGQYCVVMPKQDAVIAVTSSVDNMQAVCNLFWDYLLPAMQEESLPEDEAAREMLKDKLAALSLPLTQGGLVSEAANSISGRRYKLDQNSLGLEEVTFEFKTDACLITLKDQNHTHKINCGLGRRIEGTAPLRENVQAKAAVCGAWSGSDTFTIDAHFVEKPFCITWTCRFEEDRLKLDTEINVSFEANKKQSFQGRQILE